MRALKIQKKLFKVCYNVVKMKIKRKNEMRVRQSKLGREGVLSLKFSN